MDVELTSDRSERPELQELAALGPVTVIPAGVCDLSERPERPVDPTMLEAFGQFEDAMKAVGREISAWMDRCIPVLSKLWEAMTPEGQRAQQERALRASRARKRARAATQVVRSSQLRAAILREERLRDRFGPYYCAHHRGAPHPVVETAEAIEWRKSQTGYQPGAIRRAVDAVPTSIFVSMQSMLKRAMGAFTLPKRQKQSDPNTTQ